MTNDNWNDQRKTQQGKTVRKDGCTIKGARCRKTVKNALKQRGTEMRDGGS